MSDQKPQKMRLPVTVFNMVNGQYGPCLLGKLGMSDVTIKPTKNDPNKWLMSIVERVDQPNKGYGQQRPQQNYAPQGQQTSQAPKQQYAPPSGSQPAWEPEDPSF